MSANAARQGSCQGPQRSFKRFQFRHPFPRVIRLRQGSSRAVPSDARCRGSRRSPGCRPRTSGRLSGSRPAVAWGRFGRCSQWWIGDWIRFGTARWGEKYTEAARVTGYDVASLRNMAWVAAQFDLSLRSDKLSWSHHVLLAPLAEDEQRRWIAKAVEQRLSVADLRLELRARRSGDRELVQGSAGDEHSREGVGVCPHCGHALSGSGG